MTPSPTSIVADASAYAFGRPLVTNVFRGIVVETIIASALRPGLDLALEVKQAALRQSWQSPRPSVPRWDIAPREVFWDGKCRSPRSGAMALLRRRG